MRVLLIGGAGFIGSHVTDAFIEEGIWPQVLDRNQERFRQPLDGVTYICAEFGNRNQVEEVISSGIDVVVHLASSTLPKSSNDAPMLDVQMNLVESIALFEICAKHKVKRVVFASSGGTVYGIPESLPIDENHPTSPICSYGIVKLAIENYLNFFHHNYGLSYCVLRISNPYGVRQSPFSMQGAVAIFTSRILRDEPITIWGDGSILRDYVGVRDVARLCVLAAKSDAIGVFNVGSGFGVTLNQMIGVIASSLDCEPKVKFEPPRSFDVPAVVLDCSKAHMAFGWSPEVSLPEGVSEYALWAKAMFGLQQGHLNCTRELLSAC
jgi:UDP-glucose 4-epimerase